MEKKAYKIIQGHFLHPREALQILFFSLSLPGLLEKVPWMFWDKLLNKHLLSTVYLHSTKSGGIHDEYQNSLLLRNS